MFRILIFISFIFISNLFSQNPNDEFDGKQEDMDMEAIRKWIKEKRLINIKDIGGKLSLSGEVRVEFQGINERKNGIRQRGRGGATDIPTYAYDVEFNFMLDYRTDRTWASMKLEYDNDMGQVSGTTDKLALERAYLGVKLYDSEIFTMIGTIGRRNLGDVFESKIEFSSVYDGMLLRFSEAFERLGDFYCSLGTLLVDDEKNHYAYVGEVGILKIGNTGLFAKYSYIDWKKNYQNFRKLLTFNYKISQLLVGYQCTTRFNKVLKIYLAGLLNHSAKKLDFLTNNKKANYGGYVGFSLGRIQKKNDWALDINYQFVAAQAIPDYDSGGIKRGNAEGIGFYTEDPYGEGPPTTNATCVGGANFKGWNFELLYAATNNLTIFQDLEFSKNFDCSIGPKMKYFKYEIEFIYAF